MKYRNVIFIQNITEDETLQDIFDNGNHDMVFDYLMDTYSTAHNEYNPKWTDEENHILNCSHAGESDTVVDFDKYNLIVNYRLGYVGIEEIIK